MTIKKAISKNYFLFENSNKSKVYDKQKTEDFNLNLNETKTKIKIYEDRVIEQNHEI